MLYEYYFDGRKPSLKQVLKHIEKGIRQNAEIIEVSWGENMITLRKQSYSKHWQGGGWIRGISGHDIADNLNSIQLSAALNNY